MPNTFDKVVKKILNKNHKKLDNEVYYVPQNIEENVADLKLKSMGINIDKLTPEQEEYLSSWNMGT